MELQTQSELSAVGNLIQNRKRRIVAAVSTELEPEQVTSYTHLFSAAPDLLQFLENEVRLALEENEKMKPKPTLTGYRGYSGSSIYPNLPLWVDKAVQAMGVVYDDEPSKADSSLSVSLNDENALEDSNGNIVVRVSDELDRDTAREYVCLFLAADQLLSIVEEMSKTAFKRHEVGQEVETRYKYIFPDRLKLMSDLVAKAKGAVPFSAS
jgi:hypothetical protein